MTSSKATLSPGCGRSLIFWRLAKKPLQVYLREDQLQALRALAEKRGAPMAGLVRQGVDKLLAEVPVEEDPALDIIGLFDSSLGDLAEKHDEYIAKWIHEENKRKGS